MTDVDRLHRHLEERARIATVEATPLASIVGRAKQRDRRRRAAIGAFGVAAVGGLAVGALWMGGSDDKEVRSVDSLPGTVETTPSLLPADSTPAATTMSAPGTGGESAFAAAIEASGLLTSPSADDAAQATDNDLYRDGDVGMQISSVGNSVSLRRCRDSESATCGTGWAYVTEVAGGGEVHGGLLGEASPVNLQLQLLDERYFVASESAPDAQAPSRAWLIDAVSGQAGVLGWRDEPTTLNSPAQMLLLCEESYNSFATHCAVVRGPDAADGGWQFLPTEGGLPRVVDARDGTIRPLAVPDDVVAGLPVAQHGTGRIWIGTDPDGDRLGLAYSDDGGASWNEVALPQQISATSEELATSLLPYGDDLLEIAADGDRVAVARSWGGDNNTVYVSDDAGTSWTTAASEPGGNGVHLYVLADGRLVVMGSIDTRPNDLFASTGSDWAELDNVDFQFADPESLSDKRFSVNGAGVAMIHSFMYPCDGAYPCPGYTMDEAERATLDTIDVSTDLRNWSTIQIPNP